MLPPLSPQLLEDKNRLDAWRETAGRRPIPDVLWKAAVCHVKEYGLNRVSRKFRLGYSKLKKKTVALSGSLPAVKPAPSSSPQHTFEDGSAGMTSLQDFMLEPGEIRLVREELINALKALNLTGNNEALSIEIAYSSNPGTIVASAQSVSQNAEQVFLLPLVDPDTKGAAGNYPWYITHTSTPVVFLKNTSDKPQNFTVQIDYDGGAFVNGLKTIPAHQTIAFDIRQLRDSQAKDERGKTIPLEAASGKISWSVVGPDSHSMIGRIEQFDLINGVSYSFACSNCCPNSEHYAYVNPNVLAMFIGDQKPSYQVSKISIAMELN